MPDMGEGNAGERFDVLIVTAVKEEWDAVLEVDTGAVPGSTWERRTAPSSPEVRVRSFAVEGGELRIAVTQAYGMGGVAAVSAASPFLEKHGVRCLAMCGVCAGRRGDVELGDVIIADRMWTYDTGKRAVDIDRESGQRTEHDKGDMEMYRLHPPEWKQRAERFEHDPQASWLALRPRSYEAQGDWVLERVLAVADPIADSEREVRCANLDKVLERLWKKELLEDGTLTLTEAGKKHIQRKLLLSGGKLPAPKAFKTHVGPIASGSKVIEDPGIFAQLSTAMRKVLGLEMEGAAIATLGYERQLEGVVVMKGVMDHADADKSDNFKIFAARASAECLIAFLRENLPPRTAKDPDDVLIQSTSEPPAEPSPAALLNARYEVVPFFGRDSLLKEIHAWCDDRAPVRARLFHGPGGMGKTRLFMEACARMRREGWRAGFLRAGVDKQRLEAFMPAESPTLAVIDYAESRPDLRDILAIAARLRSGKGHGRLRLVLLARNAGDWWTSLQGSNAEVGVLLGHHAPRELSPLVPAGPTREAAFQKAALRFAAILGKRPPATTPPLDDPRYDRVLYIHMAALATVEGLQFTAETLTGSTLDHEQRFWLARFPHEDDLDEQRFIEGMRRTVAALTLRGGASSPREATELVARMTKERGERLVDRRVRFLRSLYPGQRSPSGGSRYLGGLEPDLLGEAMVYRALSHEGGDAGAYLDRVLERAREDESRAAFTVLGRLSEEQPEDAERWIAHVLGHDVAGRAMAAFEAAQAVGERTAHARLGMVLARMLEREGTIELAVRLARAGSPEHTVSLREVVLWVEKKQLQHLPEDSEPEVLAERARLLNNLGHRQSEIGQWEAALASTQQAVAHFRTLAEQQPVTYPPYLAVGFNNLGVRPSELGQWEAPLTFTQEAVKHYRKLAKQRPDAFLPHLAGSLNNLGARQSKLGQREAALASTQEAVEHYRKLDKQRPDAFLPYLAGSLNNLGNRQSELGQREAALASTQEAVEHNRKLAKERPDAFLPDLAGSLNNLGNKQSELGHREAALASTQEAVELRRTLAKERPDAFLPDLAMSLNNLGARQSGLGQREAALTSIQEAVEHCRKLAKERPDAFLPDLAGSLNNLGVIQSELGHREAALASTQEAVEFRRTLAKQRPDAFLPDLAVSLNNLGARQSELGQREQALASKQEALDAIWPFFLAVPQAFVRNTAVILHGLLECIEALGQFPAPELMQRIEIFKAKQTQ